MGELLRPHLLQPSVAMSMSRISCYLLLLPSYMVFSLTVGDHLSAVVISKQALDIHSYFPPTHKYGQLTFPYLHFIQFNTTCSLLLNILPIINTLYGGTIMPTCLVCIPITQILSMHASFSLCSFQSQI